MNIWLIQTGEPLPLEEKVKKMRTAILADKLIEKGHNVLWWVSGFDHFNKGWSFNKDTEITLSSGLKIKALVGCGYKKNISLSRIIDHRIVSRKFKRLAPKMPKPDIVIASMPPHDLAYEAVRFAKAKGIPVLVDIRDPWPDVLLSPIPKGLQELGRLLLHGDFEMIKKTMQMADGLIAVTKTFLGWGLKYAAREKMSNDRVLPLGHKRCKYDESKVVKHIHLYAKLKDKFIIFFVGTMSKSFHDPSILLKVAEKFSASQDIHFILSGSGELLGQFEKATKNTRNVNLTGWLNQDEIEFWLSHSAVGICPATKKVDLPTNKVFSYLSAGLPVISAFEGDLKEIIEKRKIGFYYPPNDVDALVARINKLYQNKELYDIMSSNAKLVFDEMFDADKIYKEYVEHIEKVAAGC